MKTIQQDVLMMVETSKLRVIDQPMPELRTSIKEELEESIRKFGIKNPLRISSNYTIIDGRNRFAIANELGIKMIPCIISDTEEHPEENALKYDLELCRRSLSLEQRNELKEKRNRYLRTLEEESLAECIKKIIPDLHATVRNIYEEEGDIAFIKKLSAKSEESQRGFIREKEIFVGDDIDEDVATKLERLTEAERDLKQKLSRSAREHDELQKNYKELEKKAALLESGMKKEVEKRIEQIEKEIESKYSENGSSNLKELLEDESNKIKAVYDNELSDLQKKLKEMSQSRKEVSLEVDQLREEIETVKRQKQDVELVQEKMRDDLKLRDTLLKSLVKPDKFAKRFELIHEDLNNIFVNLVEVGRETIEVEYLGMYKDTVSRVKEVLEELEEFLK